MNISVVFVSVIHDRTSGFCLLAGILKLLAGMCRNSFKKLYVRVFSRFIKKKSLGELNLQGKSHFTLNFISAEHSVPAWRADARDKHFPYFTRHIRKGILYQSSCLIGVILFFRHVYFVDLSTCRTFDFDCYCFHVGLNFIFIL